MSAASARLRRSFVALLLLSVTAIACGPKPAHGQPSLLRGKHIVFIEPYEPNSVTSLPIVLMRGALERQTGASITIKAVGGRAGGSTLDALIHEPKGSLTFGVVDLTSRLLAETVDGRASLLTQVQPVALVSTGASASLIVAQNSPIKNFTGFLRLAKAKQLRLVHLGRKALFGIELAMLEKSFGVTFIDKVVDTRAQILAALASGEADAGFLMTYTLLPSPGFAAPPVRPILSFAAEPNPDFVVPTLKQRASDPKAASAAAVAIFAPAGMPKDVVAAMQSALAAAADDGEVIAAATAWHFPLEAEPGPAVLAAMKRCARIIKVYEPGTTQ